MNIPRIKCTKESTLLLRDVSWNGHIDREVYHTPMVILNRLSGYVNIEDISKDHHECVQLL